MRILVVDDAEPVREMLRCTLEVLGHEVVADAATGKEALAAYESVRPDLVMLDFVLPDLSGLEVLRRLRERDPRAQVIVLTGNNTADLSKQVKEQGGVCVMEKPFNPDVFNKALTLVRRGPRA
jgi:two-component system chemotaxis response regulator CheY